MLSTVVKSNFKIINIVRCLENKHDCIKFSLQIEEDINYNGIKIIPDLKEWIVDGGNIVDRKESNLKMWQWDELPQGIEVSDVQDALDSFLNKDLKMKFVLLRQVEDIVFVISKHRTLKSLEARYRKIGFFRREGTFGETFWIADLVNNRKQQIMGMA